MQRFLNRERLTVYPRIFVVAYIVIYGYMTLSGSGSLDYNGKPIGSDFVAFWAASQLILSGQAPEIYDHEKLFQAEEKSAGKRYPLPINYPPVFASVHGAFFTPPIFAFPYPLALDILFPLYYDPPSDCTASHYHLAHSCLSSRLRKLHPWPNGFANRRDYRDRLSPL